jgi:hypothetical protein
MHIRALLISTLLLAAAAPAAANAAQWVGFNDLSSISGRVAFPTAAQAADDAGATSTRAIVDWSWIEGSPGQYSWGMLDGMYWAAVDRGVRPLIGITGAPRWAWPTTATCPTTTHCAYPPGRAFDGAYQEVLKRLARRYPQAVAIQVGNEPNLSWAWAGGLDPARYTELLKLAYGAVKSVNPAMPVISAGLAPVLGEVNTPDAIGLRRYLQAMYANGAKGYMDGVAVHAYPYSVNFANSFTALSAAKEVRSVNGDSVPLWVTEFGMTTSTAAFTPFDQGITLPALYDALRNDPDIKGVYLHTLYDDSANGELAERGYGLIGADFKPKPAFCNIARANGSSWRCPAGTATAVASTTQTARWKAQVLLQAAADAARKFRLKTGSYTGLTTTALNALDPRIKKPEALDTALPVASADPARIAILPLDANGVLLCNSSAAGVTYCYGTKFNTRWLYASTTGTIVSTANALMIGTSTSW